MLKVEASNFLKKRLWHSCFSANFAKFLRAPFLQNTFGGCLWKVWLTYFMSLVSLYTPWKGFRFGKIQFFRILKKMVTVLSKMALFYMYLPSSYKSSIILSLLKIVTLDFTMYVIGKTILYVMLSAIWYHLYNLKNWKTPMEECYF